MEEIKETYKKTKRKMVFLTQIGKERVARYKKCFSILTQFINHGFQKFSGNVLCFIIFENIINGR